MPNSKAGAGNTQDEPGPCCSTKKQESAQEKNIQWGISNGCKNQLKELPMAKVGTIEQQNK